MMQSMLGSDARMNPVEKAIAEIDEQGYAIVRQLVSGEQLKRLQDSSEELLHTISAKGIDGKEVEGRMNKGTIGVSRAFDDIIIQPTLFAIVNGVLNIDRAADYPHEVEMNDYLVSLDSQDHSIKCNIMIKDNVPREDIRAMHRDVRIPVPKYHRPVVCNSLLALDSFTEEAGATCVVPGSHKWEGPLPEGSQTMPVEMDPGDIVVFDGELWHGHGPNMTYDQNRRCLNLNYHYRWLDNFPNPKLDPSVWAALPEALRAVI